MKIYVASSWRNPHQPAVVTALREDGHEVYDFRNPADGEHGFSWHEIGESWQDWTADEYINALEHPTAERGYRLDFNAMNWCDVCVMVLPCGASANTEAAWCKGNGKKTAVLICECELASYFAGDPPLGCASRFQTWKERGWEPELMYKMHDLITPRLDDVRKWLLGLVVTPVCSISAHAPHPGRHSCHGSSTSAFVVNK